ncbi:MAG: DUF2281 domain-containing protein [Edaphobacter sp.]
MTLNVNTLSEKIQTLSAEQISEVEDFVEFLRVRGQERELTHAAAARVRPRSRRSGIARKTTFTMPYRLETEGYSARCEAQSPVTYSDYGWMDRGDSAEPAEIRSIEGEDMRDAVYIHGSGKPGIVNLNAGDTILHYNPPHS